MVRRRVPAIVVVVLSVVVSACAPRPEGWAEVPLPVPVVGDVPAEGFGVLAVGCAPGGFCLVAGGAWTGAGETYRYVPFAFGGTPGRWQRLPEPPDRVIGLSCASETTCAAKLFDRGVAAWDGTRWHHEPTMVGPGGGDGVSCGAPGHCVAMIGDRMAVWDGQRWTVTDGSHPGPYSSVSCVTARFCLGLIGHETDMGIRRWDGTAWTALPALAPREGHRAVPSHVSCWAVDRCMIAAMVTDGPRPPAQVAAFETRLVSWDGAAYTESGSSPTLLTTLSCAAGGRCLAFRPLAAPYVMVGDAAGWRDAPPIAGLSSGVFLLDASCSHDACLVAGLVPAGLRRWTFGHRR